MVLFGVIESIDLWLLACRGKVRGITIDEFTADEVHLFQHCYAIATTIFSQAWVAVAPPFDDAIVKIERDTTFSWLFMTQDCAPAEMGFDICVVGRHKIDDMLKTLALSSRISHP